MEPLSDPKNDRVVKDIEPPPALPISDRLLFPQGHQEAPDWKALRSHIFREGRVTKEHCFDLIRAVSTLTTAEPNLLCLTAPVSVVGDIHGQFYDMIKLLEVGGDPDKTQYLFLGDYVDRGSFSIEVLLVLFALKLCHPKSIWFLRGNHECRQMTAFFNFRHECEYKYDLTVYHAFMELFDTFPLAVVIDNKFFCLHGGLSPDLDTITQIGAINRFQEPPRAGLFCDLLWADPVDEEKSEHLLHQGDAFFPNDVRGCSFFFGYEAATRFLHKNHLLSVIRAHEAQLEGFRIYQTSGFPTVITIFSAPNYCDCYNNKGAVLKFENNTLNIQQFNFSPHPYHLPNFMDIFTWSIPFVSEKVTEMLYVILNPSVEEFEEEDDDVDDVELPEAVQVFMHRSMSLDDREAADLNEKIRLALASINGADIGADSGGASAEAGATTTDDSAGGGETLTTIPLEEHQFLGAADSEDAVGSTSGVGSESLAIRSNAFRPVGGKTISRERAEAMRKKVQSIGRLLRVFRTLRQQNELIVQLKRVTPDHRIPPGALLKGEEGLRKELFSDREADDPMNEGRPLD